MATAGIISVETEVRLDKLERGLASAQVAVAQSAQKMGRTMEHEGPFNDSLLHGGLKFAIALKAAHLAMDGLTAAAKFARGDSEGLKKTLEGLPLLGGLIRSVNELHNALTGAGDAAERLAKAQASAGEKLIGLRLPPELAKATMDIAAQRALVDQLQDDLNKLEEQKRLSIEDPGPLHGPRGMFNTGTDSAKRLSDLRSGVARQQIILREMEQAERNRREKESEDEADKQTKIQSDSIQKIAEIKRQTMDADRKKARESIEQTLKDQEAAESKRLEVLRSSFRLEEINQRMREEHAKELEKEFDDQGKRPSSRTMIDPILAVAQIVKSRTSFGQDASNIPMQQLAVQKQNLDIAKKIENNTRPRLSTDPVFA